MKNIVLSNLLWKFGERISAQLIAFFTTILIARILTPEDYGIVANASNFR
jgi:O-antigen/teichoic acid export membrane protein